MPDLDVAKELRAGADHHAAPDLRVTVLFLLAGAAERHTVQDRHIVVDRRGFADDQAGRMIEEDAAANARIWIDVGREHGGRTALQIEREILAAFRPKPVREAM